MKSSLLAILAILILATAAFLYAAKKLGGIGELFQYLKKNKGILGGIIAFTLVAVIAIWATRADADPQPIDYGPKTYLSSPTNKSANGLNVQWFQGGWMYVGLDVVRKESPQCHPGEVSDQLTSNGGFEANILQSLDQRLRVNAKYTHHSCAFNDDYRKYDSLGVVVVWKLW